MLLNSMAFLAAPSRCPPGPRPEGSPPPCFASLLLFCCSRRTAAFQILASRFCQLLNPYPIPSGAPTAPTSGRIERWRAHADAMPLATLRPNRQGLPSPAFRETCDGFFSYGARERLLRPLSQILLLDRAERHVASRLKRCKLLSKDRRSTRIYPSNTDRLDPIPRLAQQADTEPRPDEEDQ